MYFDSMARLQDKLNKIPESSRANRASKSLSGGTVRILPFVKEEVRPNSGWQCPRNTGSGRSSSAWIECIGGQHHALDVHQLSDDRVIC